MNDRLRLRLRRHRRVRYKVQGTAERPRLAVFRSAKNIYVQIINDDAAHTLVATSTLDSSLKSKGVSGANIDAAKAVGALIASKAKEAGITKVVFDRGGFQYHGRIQSLADAAREGGLEF